MTLDTAASQVRQKLESAPLCRLHRDELVRTFAPGENPDLNPSALVREAIAQLVRQNAARVHANGMVQLTHVA